MAAFGAMCGDIQETDQIYETVFVSCIIRLT